MLHYFGLANASDRRFEEPARPAPPPPAPVPKAKSEEPSEVARALKTAAVYFGLVDDPDKSRYGDVERVLDDDIDALRARVAELERRLDLLSEP